MIDRRGFLASTATWGLLSSGAKAFTRETASSDVGQLLITGFRGTTPSDIEVEKVRRFIEDGYVAGVILLRRNIRSPEQLLRLTSSLQSASADYPVIIAIDQEGGGGHSARSPKWLYILDVSRKNGGFGAQQRRNPKVLPGTNKRVGCRWDQFKLRASG